MVDMSDESKCFILPSGAQEWRLGYLIHRTDGPAFITTYGYQAWFQYGLLHRTDGPASYWTTYAGMEWWLNGERYSFDKWLEETPIDDERKLLLKLQYG
jgi:hypothetical protein